MVVDMVVFPSGLVGDTVRIVSECGCLVVGIVGNMSRVDPLVPGVPAEKGIEVLCGENRDCLLSLVFDVMKAIIEKRRDHVAVSYWCNDENKRTNVMDKVIKLIADKAPSSLVKITIGTITNSTTASKGGN